MNESLTLTYPQLQPPLYYDLVGPLKALFLSTLNSSGLTLKYIIQAYLSS